MKYLSLFSGIEAATVAWEPLGWEPVAFSEIEPFPCAVLKHHYPDVPNFGDVTQITEADIAALGPIDIVVFGSPCQDLSVAGHRKGLINDHGDATRSGLFFTAVNIIHWAREHCGCRYALWENVPGAYSSNKGRDFASVVEWLAGLDECPVPPRGWATEGVAVGDNGLVEWACLDAQWFGVAQRRRRVFALADFGDWASRPPILLEPEGVRGDSPPSREKGEENSRVAGTLAASCGGLNRPAGNANELDFCVTAKTLTTKTRIDFETKTLLPMSFGIDYELGVHGLDKPTGTLLKGSPTGGGHPLPAIVTGVYPLAAGAHPPASADISVRRLTPVECERLQGFPDGYTDIQPKGRATPDTPRYRALGNSMAVPVMRWIGERINSMEALNAKL